MRMIVLRIVASFLFATGLLGSAHSAQPGSYSSLQPFVQFDEGEGHGYALEYRPRDKGQFVAWLGSGKMRVPCDVFVRQVAQVHPGFPGEACEGAAHEIETNADYQVVACEDSMLRANWLVVTSPDGKKFGTWHRRCYKGEQVLTYTKDGKVSILASTTCGNPMGPVAPVTLARAVVAAPLPNATAACPKGITLYANVWKWDAIPDPLRGEVDGLISAANGRDSRNATVASVYWVDDVSRKLTEELIRVVNTRSSLPGVAIVANILDPVTLKVVTSLGEFSLEGGIARIPLTEDQWDTKIIETIWPDWFSSPTVSGGLRRLWVYPGEMRRRCGAPESGVFKEVNRP